MNRARLIEKLENMHGSRLTSMARCGADDVGNAWFVAISHEAKRIRSIIRRLKQCPVCLGRRVVYGRFAGQIGHFKLDCPDCNGTGRVA